MMKLIAVVGQGTKIIVFTTHAYTQINVHCVHSIDKIVTNFSTGITDEYHTKILATCTSTAIFIKINKDKMEYRME